MSFYKTIVIAIFKQWLYHNIFFPCQALIILGSFDKIVPMKKWALDIASGNWVFDVANED